MTWYPLIEMINKQDIDDTLDGSYMADGNSDMVATAVGWIESGSYDLVFAAFDTVDSAGHSTGFDGYVVPYSQAVAATDLRVGKMFDAVLSRSDGEEWLAGLTTDHGGSGTSRVKPAKHEK